LTTRDSFELDNRWRIGDIPLALSTYRSENKREARARILEMAIFAFAAHGYAAASVRQIANAAAVTKPMVYYYFGSKDGLFRAALEAAETRRRQPLDRAAAASGSSRERLLAIVRASCSSAAESPAACALLQRCTGPFGQDKLGIGAGFRSGFGDVIRRVAEEGVARGELRPDLDLDLLADILDAMTSLRASHERRADAGHEGAAERACRAATLLLEGAGPRS
jgi:TetR/AcrR family transcriptional regulator